MNPPPEPADVVLRLRQQLILAQVRIMELEDARDALAPRLAATERHLHDAQSLADSKLEEATHQARVLAELQAHADHLRHIQHVTHTALEHTRAELAAAHATLGRTEADLTAANTRSRKLEDDLEHLSARLAECEALARERAQRLATLDLELSALKRSRSWRWTAWLRSLERAFRRSG